MINYVRYLDLFGTPVATIPCVIGNGVPNDDSLDAASQLGMLYIDADTSSLYKCVTNSEGELTWVAQRNVINVSFDDQARINVEFDDGTSIIGDEMSIVSSVTLITDTSDVNYGKVDISYLNGDHTYIAIPNGGQSEIGVENVYLEGSKLKVTYTNGSTTDILDFASDDSIAPHIGTSGNWIVGGRDTGVKAEGTDGTTPQKGVDYLTEEEIAESHDQIFNSLASECVDIGSWINPSKVDIRFDSNVTPVQIECGSNSMFQQCMPSTEWETSELTWIPESSCDISFGIRALRPSTCMDIESIRIQSNSGSIFTDNKNSYVANVNFEDGTVGGWSQLQYEYGKLSSKGVYTTDQRYSGNGCMNLQLVDWHAGPYYSIGVTPNHKYRLTMKYKSTNTAGASTDIIVSKGNWNHTSNKGETLSSATLSASSTEWTDVTVEFESGENSFVTVYFKASALAGSNLYIDEFAIQCILDEDNLLSDQLSSVWLQDYYMTQNGTLLKSDGYWSWSDVDPYYYLIHTKALHFEKDVPYTLTIKWRNTSLKATSNYITFMDNDKIGLFTEECEPTEAVQSGGPWVGNQVTNSMASITVRELHGGPHIGPTAVKVHVTSLDYNYSGCYGRVGVQYGGSFFQIRDVSGSRWIVFNIPRDCPLEEYLTISVMNPGIVNKGNLLAIDKVCVIGNAVNNRRIGYKIFPDKKVEFENVVIAPRIETNIDDGCLTLY